jgi:hypothetical protein
VVGTLGLQGTIEKGPGIKLWRDAAVLLRVSADLGLGDDDRAGLLSMYAALRMAPRYRARVADQMGASLHAALYERYEDILLRLVLEQALQRPAILVELGSGVGRILHQYASCLKNEDSAATYKYSLGTMYSGENLPHRENLRLLLGLDFQQRMLVDSAAWLKESKLSSTISDGTLVQILGAVQHLPLMPDHAAFEWATKVVCILFQTIGNQLTPHLRAEMLRKAWDVAKPSGIVLVSAFNGTVFEEQAIPYYADIRASVGKPLYAEARTLLTARGVYSKWMTPQELSDAFDVAGIPGFRVLAADELPIAKRFRDYLQIGSQKRSKSRALVGVAAVGVDFDVTQFPCE